MVSVFMLHMTLIKELFYVYSAKNMKILLSEKLRKRLKCLDHTVLEMKKILLICPRDFGQMSLEWYVNHAPENDATATTEDVFIITQPEI